MIINPFGSRNKQDSHKCVTNVGLQEANVFGDS